MCNKRLVLIVFCKVDLNVEIKLCGKKWIKFMVLVRIVVFIFWICIFFSVGLSVVKSWLVV